MKAIGYRPKAQSARRIRSRIWTCRCHSLVRAICVSRSSAISVNPADVKMRANVSPPLGEARVLGFDAAGVVDAVGTDVTLFRPGDEVFYAGSL